MYRVGDGVTLSLQGHHSLSAPSDSTLILQPQSPLTLIHLLVCLSHSSVMSHDSYYPHLPSITCLPSTFTPVTLNNHFPTTFVSYTLSSTSQSPRLVNFNINTLTLITLNTTLKTSLTKAHHLQY